MCTNRFEEYSQKMKNWDNVFASKDCIDALPCDALRDNIHLIPQGHGKALDLACGMGGNAIFLAQNSNLDVYAWDMSSVAISKNSNFIDTNEFFENVFPLKN